MLAVGYACGHHGGLRNQEICPHGVKLGEFRPNGVYELVVALRLFRTTTSELKGSGIFIDACS